MNWKRCFSAVLAVALSLPMGKVTATAQIPDAIVIDGRQYDLNTNPLDRYLRKLGDAAPRFEPSSTALWRGYVASWELDDGRLFLRAISVPRYDREGGERKPVDMLRTMFPGDAEVVAGWYSGALIVPDGEMVEYVHMGYGSTYERYIVVLVRNGIETKRLRLSEQEFRQYRDAQFWKFKASDAYRAMVDQLKSDRSADGGTYSMSDEQIDRFILEFSAEEYLSAVDEEDTAEAAAD